MNRQQEQDIINGLGDTVTLVEDFSTPFGEVVDMACYSFWKERGEQGDYNYKEFDVVLLHMHVYTAAGRLEYTFFIKEKIK